jgi:hypothetical protein
MARIRLNELAKIKVERELGTEDEEIVLTLKADDGVVEVSAGRSHDDAVVLEGLLADAHRQAKTLMDEWVETPDEYDGFIYLDRSGWGAQLEGVNVPGGQGFRPGELPCREAALYALAKAMADQGSFPAAWYQERGISVEIDSEIRAFHDKGGSKMLDPLPGQQYHEDDEIQVADGDGGWWNANVVFDTGHCVVYVLSGDDEIHHYEDRAKVRPQPQPDES